MESDPIEMSSPTHPPQALYNNPHYGDSDTIATQPLTTPYKPYNRPQSRTPNNYITQPTQPMRTPPHQTQQLSQILVPGSSSPQVAPMYRPPMTGQQRQPPPMYRPPTAQMYNPMMMAPPGTSVNVPRPFFQQLQFNGNSQSQPPMTQYSDTGDADGQVSDSDDELRRADIPPSFRNGKTIAANTNSHEQFKNNISAYNYNPNAQRPIGAPMYRPQALAPQKRGATDSLSAYANVSRPPKQQRTGPGPSPPRTQVANPVPPHKKYHTIADIPDFAMQRKAQMILNFSPYATIDEIVLCLELKRGHVDDAADLLTSGNARQIAAQIASKSQNRDPPIDLTGEDEDADGSTDEDVQITKTSKPTANRNFEAQKAGLAAYSRLQQKPPPPPSTNQDLYSSPPPKQFSRLKVGVRPDRSRSSSVQPSGVRKPVRKVIDDDEESEAEESDVEEIPEPPRESVDDKVFKFLQDCTTKELVSMIDCKPEDAEFLISNKPFKSLDAVRKVARPVVAGKKKGGNQRPLGDRLVEQLISTEESLMAVDRIVDKCQSFLGDVRQKMNALGIDVSKAVKDDGLAIASFEEAGKDSPRVDSGTGTPNPHASARIQQPSNMSKDRTLKDYQLVGLNWLDVMFRLRKKWNMENGCILADEMGLGKTYQVISFISHLVESGNTDKHLIVVPASTLENWLREFQLFSPDLHVEPYYGNQALRKQQQLQIEAAGNSVRVMITTYQIAASDGPWLRRFKFGCAIFDEGHKLKNAKSKGYQTLIRLKAGFRLFLTGTPLQNNLQELISVLAFIMPNLFDENRDDLDMIFDCKAKTNDSDHAALLAAQRTSRAKEMLKPFILRRTKDQVLKDLPAKTNRIVYCDMPPMQQEVYDHFTEIHEQALRDRIQGKSQEESGKFPHLQDRRAAAIHPLLRRQIYSNDDIEKMIPKIDRKQRPWSKWSDQTIFENLTWSSDWDLHDICEKHKIKKPGPLKNEEWMQSGKVTKLVELLREHKIAGSRTLIFSQYAKVLDILGRVLETEDVTHVRLDGTTPTEDRLALIDKFNDDPTIQAFMITTRSGGAGINLATADKVIIVDPSFNPQDDVQAANRAHRIGQTRPVEVVTLVTKNTIEEQIYKLGLSKLALDAKVAGVGAGEDGEDSEKASAKVADRNMKRIEEMLMKGQTTPMDSEAENEVKPVKADEKDEVKAEKGYGSGDEKKDGEKPEGKKVKLKIKMKGRPKDAKEAFMEGMKKKGIEIVKNEE